eukprot:8723012-Pyramimonas_sp.AAC.1
MLGRAGRRISLGGHTAEASPQEAFHKKPNPETPGRPLILGAGTSRSPRRHRRNPRPPGHPGGQQ